MCIIVCKKKGIEMPPKITLENCFKRNSDGAGIMWNENGVVNIRKGFMTWKSFELFVDELSSRINLKKHGVVIHFRIGTHGATKPQNCHPFPISSRIRDVKSTAISSDLCVAHNGIIPIKCIRGLSDTQTYIIKRLSKLKKLSSEFYKFGSIMKSIEKETASKMAFLNSHGNIYIIGSFNEEAGILYSNDSYQEFNYFNSYHLSPFYNLDYYGGKNLTPILGYVIDGNGSLIDCSDYDYYIDANGTVYEYDYELDLAIKMKSATAYTYCGMPYHYDEKEAYYLENVC